MRAHEIPSRAVSRRGSTKASAPRTWRSPRCGARRTAPMRSSRSASRRTGSCSRSVRRDSAFPCSLRWTTCPGSAWAPIAGTHPSRRAACRRCAALSAATAAGSESARCRVRSTAVRSGMHTRGPWAGAATPEAPGGPTATLLPGLATGPQMSTGARDACTMRTPSRKPSRTPLVGSTYNVGRSPIASGCAPMMGMSHMPADVGPAMTAGTWRSPSCRARLAAHAQASAPSVPGRAYSPPRKRRSAPARTARSSRSGPIPRALASAVVNACSAKALRMSEMVCTTFITPRCRVRAAWVTSARLRGITRGFLRCGRWPTGNRDSGLPTAGNGRLARMPTR